MATYIGTRKRGGRNIHRYLVRRKGSPRRVFQADTKTEAKKLARAHESKVDAGKIRGDRATVSDALGLYRKSSAFQELLTQEKRDAHLDWWAARLGALPVSQPERIHEAVNDAVAVLETEGGVSGQPASPATINRYLSALSAALEWVRKRHPSYRSAMYYNPARAAGKRKEPKGKTRIFSDDEFHALWKACKASEDRRLEPLFLLACSSGARKSELLNLRRPDVNLETGRATLWRTKSGKERVIFFQGPAVEALRRYMEATPEPITRHVFVGPRGVGTEPRAAWEAAMREAGVKDAGWHTARHSSLTWLATLGANEQELRAHGGHSTTLMLDRYVHLGKVTPSRVAELLVRRQFQAA